VGLIAREIERAGVPTVSIGSALDITRAVRPPRAVYLHYPLGHQGGQPGDLANQIAIARAALAAGAALREPGEVTALPFRWDRPGDEGWEKTAYTATTVRLPRDGKPDRGPAGAMRS
jgi:D-proline reductase (dithiol) PrdB